MFFRKFKKSAEVRKKTMQIRSNVEQTFVFHDHLFSERFEVFVQTGQIFE